MFGDLPFLDAAFRLVIAFALGLPIGMEREWHIRSAGLRTYPLLSAGICGFLLVAQGNGWGTMEQADVIFGVLNGIGFVGSGVILKSKGEGSEGIGTAVSLWVAGAIGVGVAYGLPVVSTALALATAAALWAPSHVGRRS